MSLRLYWSPDSANLVVRIALHALDLLFGACRVDRSRAQHKTPDYLAKNPQGLLPVLEDGDLLLFETGAILWHLVERTGRLGPAAPDAHALQLRTNVLKWLFYISNTVHADLRLAFYGNRYVDDSDALEGLRHGVSRRLAAHCDMLNAQLDNVAGLSGDFITVADIYLAVCLRWSQIYPRHKPVLTKISNWAALYRLCERVELLPAARKAFSEEMISVKSAITMPTGPTLPIQEITGKL